MLSESSTTTRAAPSAKVIVFFCGGARLNRALLSRRSTFVELFIAFASYFHPQKKILFCFVAISAEKLPSFPRSTRESTCTMPVL